jgi:hypothetical protein
MKLTRREKTLLRYYLSRSVFIDEGIITNTVAEEAAAGNDLAKEAMELRRKLITNLNPTRRDSMKNWKTTLFGALQAAALGYVGYKTGDSVMVLAAASALVGGIAAKDSNVTGGTVAQ